jgi:EmrB/QacA subfamily drug resistance transporter
VLLSILAGTFLIPVNSTMIAVGLPTITESLHSSLPLVSWVVTVYLIVMAVLQPIAGKLGDLYGNRKMFLLGMSLFLGASAAAIFSMNLFWLIGCRAIQAIGGALAAPNASAVVRYVTPKEKLGRTLGLFGLSMGIGAALGPLAGAFLISHWGWPSIFWVNIPFALVSVLASFLALPKVKSKTTSSLDVYGCILLAVSLVTLILLVTHPEWLHVGTIALLLLAIWLFIRQEKKCESPLIQFDLFKNGMFTSANVSILLGNGIMYSTILVMPILMQREFGLSMQTIGFLLFLFSLSMSLSSWIGGYFSDRVGPRQAVMLSFIVTAAGLIAFWGMYWVPSYSYRVLAMVIGGIGCGIGSAPMQAASLQAVPKEMSGIASGIFSTSRYLGGIIATVLVSLLVDYRILFAILLGFAAAGIPASLGLGKPTASRLKGIQ